MSDPPPPPDAPQETFLSHLFELRTRLVRAIVAVVVVLFCLFPWAKDIYAALAAPLLHALPKGATMIATDVTGTFFVPLKVTLMAAFLLALPYVLWQVWAFVAPGLYHHEKRLAIPVIVSSFVFFLIGMSFAYFVVFPIAFGFFASYAPEGVTMMTDIDKYLSFVLTMFIAFGVTFEVPVVVIVLVRLRMVSLEKLRSIRSYVIVGAFVAGAIFTPPDVVSQLLLAVPLWLLYEFGMLMARFFVPPVGDDSPAESDAAGSGASRTGTRQGVRYCAAGRRPTMTSTPCSVFARQTFTRDGAARGQFRDPREQRRRVARRLAVDLEHDVAHLNPGAIGRAVLHDAADQHAADVLERERPGDLRGDVLRLEPQPAARHGPVPDDLLEHGAGERYRDRETDAERAPRLGEDGAVDADQVAGGVHQRTAGVAGVDRGIGLDEVLEAVDAEMVAAERADDAERHRAAEAEGIADREHEIAHLHPVERAERDGGEVLAVRLQHGEVGLGIRSPHARRDAPAVGKHDLNVVGAFDHVIVGQDVAFRRNDDTRAEARRALPRQPLGEVGKVTTQQRVVLERSALAHFLARVDAHDRGHRFPGGVGKTGDRRRVHRRRGFLQQHDLPRLLAQTGNEVGPQRRDDEQRGDTQRAGLREHEPETAEQGEPRGWGTNQL